MSAFTTLNIALRTLTPAQIVAVSDFVGTIAVVDTQAEARVTAPTVIFDVNGRLYAPTTEATVTPPVRPTRPARRMSKAQAHTWNSKITALAAHGRPAGTHKALMARWSTEVPALRMAGYSPAKALKALGL